MTLAPMPLEASRASLKSLLVIGVLSPLLAGCLLTDRQLIPRDDAIRIADLAEGRYCEIDEEGPDNAEDAASYLFGCFDLAWDEGSRGYLTAGADSGGPHRMKPLDWDRNLYLGERDFDGGEYGKIILVAEGSFFRVGYDTYHFSNWDDAVDANGVSDSADEDGWTTVDQSGGRLLSFFADIGRPFADGIGGEFYFSVDNAASPQSFARSVADTWFEGTARDHVGRILEYLPTSDSNYDNWTVAYVILGGDPGSGASTASAPSTTNEAKPIFGGESQSSTINQPKPTFDSAPEETSDSLLARAEAGDIAAQADLGRAYYFGDEGFAGNDAEAFRWFREAGRAGDAESQSFLGYMYAEGIGVERDEVAAAAWYERAADQNNSFSQTMLGDIYRDGFGVPADKAEAYKWYSLAAEQGDEEAINGLGKLIVTMTPDEVARGQRLAQTWKDVNGY